MSVFVRVKPRSKRPRVLRVDATHFVVAVAEPPVGGKANRAVLAALADYFGVPPSRITLVSGATFREKVFEIE